MEKFTFKITEKVVAFNRNNVEIEATNYEEASKKVLEMLENGELEMDFLNLSEHIEPMEEFFIEGDNGIVKGWD